MKVYNLSWCRSLEYSSGFCQYIQAEEAQAPPSPPKAQPPGIAQALIKSIMIVKNRLRTGNLESAGIELATEGADGIEEHLFRNLSGKKDRGVRSSMRGTSPLFLRYLICENNPS
jgi:aminomethyltransferase